MVYEGDIDSGKLRVELLQLFGEKVELGSVDR